MKVSLLKHTRKPHKETLATRPASIPVYAPILHSTTRISPNAIPIEEQEERARHKPTRAFTSTKTDKSARRDPPPPYPKTPTPLLERPRRLVVVPGVHHLPPDLDPLEVDLGFRRATSPRSSNISTTKIDPRKRSKRKTELWEEGIAGAASNATGRRQTTIFFFVAREEIR
ncbi:hypothetical protein YC2023_103049 [Brassica napus]